MVEEETTAEEESRDDPVGFHEVVILVLSIGLEPDCRKFGSTAVRQARLGLLMNTTFPLHVYLWIASYHK
jgi:hypothetical protein